MPKRTDITQREAARTLGRIKAAAAALDAHGAHGGYIPDEDLQIRLTDLLADLEHWAAVNDVDFERAARVAGVHFRDEVSR